MAKDNREEDIKTLMSEFSKGGQKPTREAVSRLLQLYPTHLGQVKRILRTWGYKDESGFPAPELGKRARGPSELRRLRDDTGVEFARHAERVRARERAREASGAVPPAQEEEAAVASAAVSFVQQADGSWAEEAGEGGEEVAQAEPAVPPYLPEIEEGVNNLFTLNLDGREHVVDRARQKVYRLLSLEEKDKIKWTKQPHFREAAHWPEKNHWNLPGALGEKIVLVEVADWPGLSKTGWLSYPDGPVFDQETDEDLDKSRSRETREEWRAAAVAAWAGPRSRRSATRGARGAGAELTEEAAPYRNVPPRERELAEEAADAREYEEWQADEVKRVQQAAGVAQTEAREALEGNNWKYEAAVAAIRARAARGGGKRRKTKRKTKRKYRRKSSKRRRKSSKRRKSYRRRKRRN